MGVMEDFFQMALDASHEERVSNARTACAVIIDYFERQNVQRQDIMKILCAFTRLFVSVDRSCEQGEYELFNDVTKLNLSTDQFFELTNRGTDRQFVSDVLEIISEMDDETKKAVAVFGACICSADHEITAAEKQMILRVLQ